MLLRYNITLLFAVSCATGLYLLGTDEMNIPASNVTALPAQPPATAADKSPQAEQEKETDEQPQPQDTDKASGDPEPIKVAFEPPFPDRTNLFQAPKRQGRRSSVANDKSESAVQLLGFVDVNGPRVALSIDGLVTTAAEGDTHFGIEVISIKPPAVLLQRGRQRLQVTLEN